MIHLMSLICDTDEYYIRSYLSFTEGKPVKSVPSFILLWPIIHANILKDMRASSFKCNFLNYLKLVSLLSPVLGYWLPNHKFFS